MENEILVGIIIAIVSAALGWAASQATVGRKVSAAISDMKLELARISSDTKAAIERVGNDAHRAMDDVAAVRLDTTNRIEVMVGLVNQVLTTNRDLIDVVRVQNALMADQVKFQAEHLMHR